MRMRIHCASSRLQGFSLAVSRSVEAAFESNQHLACTSGRAPSGSMAQIVRIPVQRLLSGDASVQADIAKAYGPAGLGVLSVSGVQGYAAARRRLLSLAPQLAALPEDVLRRYEDPESSYSFGWSHGKEALRSGKRDTFKGSFYANPLVDVPCTDPSLIQQHPAYLRPNIWPRDHLPDLEPAFKDLSSIIIDTGLLLMEHCDRYVESLNPGQQPGKLKRILQASSIHKARLLHYFPPGSDQGSNQGSNSGSNQGSNQGLNAASAAPGAKPQTPGASQLPPGHASYQNSAVQQDRDVLPPQPDQAPMSDMASDPGQAWCGWHTDHGSLTGLTAAMYWQEGREVGAPDPKAGLYIRDRSGEVVKALIPAEDIAFQVGESLQIHSGGLLQATPHYVRSSSGPGSQGVSRNTFALFLQPSLSEPLDTPPGARPEAVGVGRWKQGMSFGEFANETFKAYYS